VFVLASAGFLPEELDKLFVKYVYPVFTPSVVLFVAGTTAYGVLKYIQNEKMKGQEWYYTTMDIWAFSWLMLN